MSKAKQSTRGSSFIDAFLARQRAKKTLSRLKVITDKNKILDIGCGSYPFFLEQVDFEEKFGLDPLTNDEFDIKGIKLIKQSFVGADIPFEDNSFNAITLLAVAEHLYLADDKLLFKEIFRCLKTDGIFILTTPTPWTDKLLRFLADSGLISKEEIDEHKALLPISLLKDILINIGFRSDQIKFGYFELGMNQWLSAVKK
ncbi:MAG: class I SAM-dependent methyltransferase [Patescibacteria group bacterium]|nr:class I SAM-dependent methyltransferase [Patescibacteria group bacterium]